MFHFDFFRFEELSLVMQYLGLAVEEFTSNEKEGKFVPLSQMHSQKGDLNNEQILITD